MMATSARLWPSVVHEGELVKRITTPFAALVVFVLTTALIPLGKPEDVGLSSDRLQRINQTVSRYIA